MKLLIVVILLSAFSFQSQALTEQEEVQFKAKVHRMSKLKRGLAIVLSGTGLVVSCPVGGALSGLSAVLDSFPGVSGIQSAVTSGATDIPYRPESGLTYEVLGGLPAIIADIVSAGVDITDLELDDPFFDEMRSAYAETVLVAEKAFGESGYCIDQWDQLGLLLDFK